MKSPLTYIVKVLLALQLFMQSAWAIDFNRYHDQTEIAAFLRQEATSNPDLVHFEVLGHSRQGREISLVSITKNPNPNAPAIYFNGTHHGNERASTEAVLALINDLVRDQNQPSVAKLLHRYRILLQPMVNPDGHALNLRTDSQGIDPNRDYATPNKPDREAFQIVETRLVRNLMQRERVVASAAFHSGLEAVLWPWCHSPTMSQHDPIFRTLAASVAHTMQMNRTSQSFYDYQTDGEFIDFAYMRHGTYALTFEVAQDATPPNAKLGAVVQRAVQGSFSFLKAVDAVLSRPQQHIPAAAAADRQASL